MAPSVVSLESLFQRASSLAPSLSPPASALPSLYGLYKLASPSEAPFRAEYGAAARAGRTPSVFSPTARGKYLGITGAYDSLLAQLAGLAGPLPDSPGDSPVSSEDEHVACLAKAMYVKLCDSFLPPDEASDPAGSDPAGSDPAGSDFAAPPTVTDPFAPAATLRAVASLRIVRERLLAASGGGNGLMDTAVSVPVRDDAAEVAHLARSNPPPPAADDDPARPPPPPSGSSHLTAETLHSITSLPASSLPSLLPPPPSLPSLVDPLTGSNALHFLASDPEHLPSLLALAAHVGDPALLREMVGARDSNGTTPFLACLLSGERQMVVLLAAYADVGVRDDDGEGWREYAEDGGIRELCEMMEREKAEEGRE
ncbi:hypothetical protein TeGR_g12170 [Tetraparma gracilis]|uniref:Ankyrin repeat-containing domain protein n=1 Tax=Tetraparma gracilis TaxID=2962635 RepID=A0ABQ6MCP4_9STRA|nr:hypothetical protein TeGR_g12170 [Tetraparma gracilis]